MTQTLLELVADLELSLASAVSVGATTATLSSATDGDSVALPTGKYGFTIDSDNSAKEFIVCDLNGTALTNVSSISLQGASTSGFANYHRIGATVTITDWAILSRMLNNLDGTTGFNSATPLNYDAEPSYADPLTIPTVQFVLDTASGGTVTFNRQIISGDAGETISAGEWVYYNTTDGEWYKTDADDTAKCFNVQIGKAIGAGTDGLPIDGGIFISGTETVGTYVAGTTYYLSDTAGELATSAGTNSVVVGVGDANGDLILKNSTPNQVDAMTGINDEPSGSNKFVTQSLLPVVKNYAYADSPATWTKPSNLDYIIVELWGAGGSGAKQSSTAASGGGGGAYIKKRIAAASLGATETVTIGAGAAAVSSNGNGSAGGDTTFGSLATAYGGGGGLAGDPVAGGGGGGLAGAGSGSTGGAGGGASGISTGTYLGPTGTGTPVSEGGAAGGGAASTPAAGAGGFAGAAGGGGGGFRTPSTAGVGGVSVYGGSGGAGASTGVAGTVPGGGGGGSSSGNSGAGANGQARVTEYFA